QAGQFGAAGDGGGGVAADVVAAEVEHLQAPRRRAQGEGDRAVVGEVVPRDVQAAKDGQPVAERERLERAVVEKRVLEVEARQAIQVGRLQQRRHAVAARREVGQLQQLEVAGVGAAGQGGQPCLADAAVAVEVQVRQARQKG